MSEGSGNQFMDWEQRLDNSFKKLDPHEVLSSLKPEESDVEHSKVKQKFLKIESIYGQSGTLFANISHWGGASIPWKFMGSLDEKGRLHGSCTFELQQEFYNNTGTHDFLDWSISYFSGNFHNGKLNGFGFLATWNGANIFANFKDGELHGSAFGYGRILIFNMAVGKYIRAVNLYNVSHLLNLKMDLGLNQN